MILSISNQALLFVSTIFMGAFIGFIYDWFRVIRGLFKHPNFLIHIEDIIFWFLVSGVMFLFMLSKNYGEIRMFSVCGIFIGMLIYYFTISALFLNISNKIIGFIIKTANIIVKIISAPIKLILRLLSYPYKATRKIAVKHYRNQRKRLKKYHSYIRIKKSNLKNDIKIIFRKI